jgi:hypothetical protein
VNLAYVCTSCGMSLLAIHGCTDTHVFDSCYSARCTQVCAQSNCGSPSCSQLKYSVHCVTKAIWCDYAIAHINLLLG